MMNLGWNPFRLMDDLVSTFGAPATWVAPIGYDEHDDALTITIDVPGVDAKDLDITFEGDQLVVSGKREGRGELRHVVRLPDTIDPESVGAELKNGVLAIHAAKRPETRRRKIEIRTDRALAAGNPQS